MSQELKKLKKIGAQKIHEDTHIALKYVQSIVRESFENLDKIQFTGFISILEREYNLNLSKLRNKGLAYFLDVNAHEGINKKIFVLPKKKTNFTWLYIIISVLIFTFAVYYTTTQSPTSVPTQAIDNSAIENATKNILPKKEMTIPVLTLESNDTRIVDVNLTEENLTKEINTTIIQDIKPLKVVSDTPKQLIISPKSRVWIGYINKKTGKKTQTVRKTDLILDASQTWLFSFGHTHISVHLDKKNIKIKSSNKSMRFIYENYTLKKLSAKEFKKLNKGRIW